VIDPNASRTLETMLTDLGIQQGEVVYLGIDMGRLPLPFWPATLDRESMRRRADHWCQFLFDHLMAAIGPAGTLVFPTFSYRCSNPDHVFVLEETPSETGPFTEWLRRHPDARRSLHPVFSVGAIGAAAKMLVEETGRSGFGPVSPFGRLSGLNARFVNLGVPFNQSMTYMHHLEQCYGCNHRYHKVFTTPVFRAGIQVPGPFLGYVRWLGLDARQGLIRCEQRLLAEGVMREVSWNGCVNHAVRATDVDRIGYAMLMENPCAFASRNVHVVLDESATASNPVGDVVAVFNLSRHSLRGLPDCKPR